MAAIGDHERETAELLATAVAETVRQALEPRLKPLLGRMDEVSERVNELPHAISRVRTAVDAVPRKLTDAVDKGTARIRHDLGPQEHLLHALNDQLTLLVERTAALEQRLEAQETAHTAAAREADRASAGLADGFAELRRAALIALSLSLVVPVAVLIMVLVDGRG